MQKRAVIFAMMVALTGWWCQSSPEVKSGAEPGVIMKLPDRLGEYIGKPGQADPVEKERLPSDTEFAKMTYYSSPSDPSRRDVVRCSIVLSGAERRSIHRPEVCLQGQGWSLENSRTIEILMVNGKTLGVKDLCVERKVTVPGANTQKRLRAHYMYWFVGADVATPSHLERVWLSIWDNIARNVNHRWAYPSMFAVVTDNFTAREIGERCRTDAETVELLKKFIHDLAPQFQKGLH